MIELELHPVRIHKVTQDERLQPAGDHSRNVTMIVAMSAESAPFPGGPGGVVGQASEASLVELRDADGKKGSNGFDITHRRRFHPMEYVFLDRAHDLEPWEELATFVGTVKGQVKTVVDEGESITRWKIIATVDDETFAAVSRLQRPQEAVPVRLTTNAQIELPTDADAQPAEEPKAKPPVRRQSSRAPEAKA